MFKYRSELKQSQSSLHLVEVNLGSKDAQVVKLQSDLSSVRSDLLQSQSKVSELTDTLESIPSMKKIVCKSNTTLDDTYNSDRTICYYQRTSAYRTIVYENTVSFNHSFYKGLVSESYSDILEYLSKFFGFKDLYFNYIVYDNQGQLKENISVGSKPEWFEEQWILRENYSGLIY